MFWNLPPFGAYTLARRLNQLLFVAVVLLVAISPLWADYEVRFEGISEEETLKLVKSASQLEKLKESPPATLVGLKRRADGDVANIVQALHSLAYYDAKVDITLDPNGSHVVVDIQLGPVYPLIAYNIRYLRDGEDISDDFLTCPLTLEDLKIKLGDPALPETILAAEDTLLDQLNLQGYAFASIQKRDVFADQQAKNVIVWIIIEPGPLSYFGPTKMTGLERLKEQFFFKKLRWNQGEVYDPRKIEKTQEALELSGLFRSVNISHAEKPVEGNILPMEISVLEGNQRSVGFGLNYTTALGPGFTAEWEDRNIRGEGQRLSIRTDIWRKLQEGGITYVIPDFKRQEQNLIWALQYKHVRTKAFIETSCAFSGAIERKLSEKLRVSYGGMYQLLRSQRSDHNGIFDLIKIPLKLRWTNTDSLLEPTRGETVQLQAIPSIQIFSPKFAYSINTFTGTIYRSLTPDKRHVFAAKLMWGTIIGASRHDIPPPDRLFAGSENTLRGYRYMTVSPLGCDDKPLGGRSLFIYSLELRNRIGKNFGLVWFYDIGNVYKDFYPEFKKGMLQSVGLGLRYYTPIGPLRLDIAFPLNKRHIDNRLEAYFSIGQSF